MLSTAILHKFYELIVMPQYQQNRQQSRQQQQREQQKALPTRKIVTTNVLICDDKHVEAESKYTLNIC